jgi:hypothetical protein
MCTGHTKVAALSPKFSLTPMSAPSAAASLADPLGVLAGCHEELSGDND